MKEDKDCMVRDRIAFYLKLMNLSFEWSEEHNAFLVPYMISGHKHVVVVSWSENWIIIRTGIMMKEEVPQGYKEELYRKLLQANHDYYEFAYDMDEEGNIGISEDIFIPALTFDVFWEEFNVIPLAVKYFWERIIPSLGEARTPSRTDWIYV
ncbi:MAG: hypothetical protein KIH01_03755 [Candidatus Freyarchaeota archaeon]|nr:hypothetical protein [Candidatus Jordarchaeia archaeon]